ncbi:hypothetical protein J3F83DRAFT_763886 [Trichoderma novae-zelandiae]
MEGSYNHPVKRAQTSLSAQTQPATYQVNVSRKKTRKWVEAKVQNYDGDDWGADEYDEESDQEPVPPPPINPSLRTFSGTDLLHSRHNTPSPASSLSALPSLRTQAQQQQQQPAAVPPPASQPPRIGVSSPDVSEVSIRSASESMASGHGVSPQSVTASQGHDGDSNLSLAGIAKLPSQMQQQGQQQGQQQQASGGYDVSRSSSFERSIKPTPTPPVAGDRSLSPQLSAPSVPPADQPPPIIYSPDNYSRLHDDDEREPLAPAPVMPSTAQGEQSTDFAPKPLSGEDRRDTWERDDDSPHADQPYNQGARPDIESQAGIDRGRMSVSPKLPDLARLSAFGADLFSPSTSKNHILSKNAPNIPPVIESSPDISTAHQSRWQPPAVPAEDEDHSEAPGGASLSQPNSLFPGRSIPDIPPLRTPSPHETHAAAPLFDSQATKITPTEPLQPRRGEALPDLDDPQSFRRVQTYGTAESSPLKDSPVKESDVLSDEIMRTLGPSGVTPAEVKLSDGPQLHPPEDRSAVRESSYTLMDYDSYWADTAEDSGLGHENAPVPPPDNVQSAPAAPETSPAHSAQPGLKLSTDPTPPPATATTVTFDSILSLQQSQQLLHEQQQPEEPQQSQQQDEQQPRSSLRRRFSWEAEEEQRTLATPAQAAGDGSSASALHLKPFEPSVTNLNNESRSHSPVSQLSQAPPTATGSGLGGLALQTSGTLPGYDPSLPEPPSPVSVSVKSDKPYTTDRQQARLSIADEKLLADQGSVSLVTGTPPPPLESHPAVSSPTSAVSVPAPQAPAPNPNPLAHTKAMGFREIMALPTPAERIAKYTEARQALAARDSGLESWLLYLMTEHPELSASISTPGGHLAPQSTNNASLPAGSQAPSQQQPYYQQYLNASSPSTTVPQVGGGGGGGSGSGGGRSRLGGLSMPSQMSGSAFGHSGNQIGTKGKEFMQSAGKMGKGLLSKGKSKLRGSGDKVDIVPPDHTTTNKAQRRSTWRFSLEPKPREDDSAPHSSDDISTTPPQLPDPSPVSPLNAASGPGSAFPWSVSDDKPDPDPSAGKQPDEEHVRPGELVIAGAFLHGAYVSADQEENMLSAGHGLSDLSPDAVTPDDWVMVQHQGEQSRAKRMSTSLRAMGNAGFGPAIGRGTDHHAGQPQTQNQSQPQVQYQPLDGSGSPRRNSSFIGLPPIRRGSTFGTKSKARRASERFALDDDDEDDGGLGGAGADINSPPFPPVSGIDASTHASAAVTGAELRFGQEHTANAGHPHHSQQRQWQQQSQQPQQLGQQQQQHRQQYPSGHEPQFAPAAPMLDSLVQKLPPAGPWKLEESHLSEPLHLTKKRSGTDFSQQDAYYGYDKELGLEFPAAPMPAPPGPPTRFRSDVPPSSARRYPELFQLSPGQDPRQFGRGQGFPSPMQNRPPREGIAAPRQQQGGPESDDRGRRRSAGIFKDIGSRLTRATSRERRGSASEARPPSLQLRGDEVSETSVATEDTADRKRKRASFLGFSGRPSSTEQAVRREEGMGNQARQRDTQSAGGEPPADPREERKRTFFGAGQLKLGPGNFSRSFTSNSPFESAAGAAGDGRDGGTAHKRRISDIAKASGITGLFSRSRQDRASLGAMPKQQTDDRSQHPQAQNQAATVSRPSIQLPSLDFASDPLGSMSSLGFEESFQNYSHEGDLEWKQQQQQQQQQHAFEQPAQRPFADSKAFPAVGGQERFAALGGSASPQFKPSSQIMALDPGRQNAQSHQPPPSTATPVARTNTPHTGPLTVYPAATEGQRVSGHEALETSPKSQVDSTMEEKTPRPQDFFFQEKVPPLPVKEDDESEEDVLRSQTVSPDISIASTSKTQEQAPVQLQSHTPEHDEIVEGVLITPPPEESLLGSDADLAAGRSVIHLTVSNDVPPSVHSFPSVSSLREKSDAKSIQQGVGSVHQTEGSVAPSPGPSPQAAKSQVSSKAATPVSQHQQLHSPASAAVQLPDTQNTEPPATPRSHNRSESQQQRLADAAGQRFPPTSASPLPTGTQSPQQQLRPQYPPSVSVSNASFASEVSTPVHPVQFGSQTLNPAAPGPFGRASTQPPEAAAQPKDGQASRWKGLKNRMTEQISQRTQQPQQQQQYAQQQSLNPGQNKIAMGDLIRGNKLLGALRRTSRQVEGTQNQGNVEPSPRQFQNPSPQPQPQGYQQQPGQLPGPPPIAMPANSQYLQAPGQPPNLPRAKTMPPGLPQQSAPPRNQTRSSEPRYETVPIPRGYAAVHGEGTTTIPSPYHQNLRRQMPHGQSAPLPQQHPHPHPHVQQRQQWQGGPPPPMFHQVSPPRMALGPVSAPLPNVRPAHMRAQSDLRLGYHDGRSIDSPNARLSQHNRHSSQGSHTSRAEARPISGLGSNLGTSHPGSPQPSEKGDLSGVDGTRSASRSPAVSVGADEKAGMKSEPKTAVTAEPTPASDLGIDVQKAQQLVEDDLYDATPKVAPSGTEDSHEAESSRAAETKTGPTPANTGVVAELEDTEEARKRAIRLASQEEKIYYEPEDDEPKMSATSYPGQEWNPFGEPEFADWKED